MGNRRQSPTTRRLRTSLLAALSLLALVGHGAVEGPQVAAEGHARRGSSLAGSVIEDDGRPIPDCVVEAQAHEPGALPDDPPPRTFAVRTDARGAFELTGLAAGEYWIRATTSGRSSLPEVRTLRSDKPELLTAPLVVRPAQPLELRFDPPHDPLGRPWLLSVRSRLERANPPAQDTPVEDGRWTHPGLMLDAYDVTVRDSRGNSWRTVAAVVRAPTTLTVDLGSVPVAGQVSLGGQPLAARLVFAAGGERLTLDTDAHGRYRGFLPDWNWRGSSSDWSVTVRARHVARRLLARLDWPPGGRAAPYSLDLPATTLRGVVTDEAGAPPARGGWLVLPDEGPWGRFGQPPEPPLTCWPWPWRNTGGCSSHGWPFKTGHESRCAPRTRRPACGWARIWPGAPAACFWFTTPRPSQSRRCGAWARHAHRKQTARFWSERLPEVMRSARSPRTKHAA